MEVNDSNQAQPVTLESCESFENKQGEQAAGLVAANSIISVSAPPANAWQVDAMKVYKVLLNHHYLDMNSTTQGTRNMDVLLSSSNFFQQLKMLSTFLNDERFIDEEDFFCKLLSVFQTNIGLLFSVFYICFFLCIIAKHLVQINLRCPGTSTVSKQ